MKKFGWLRLLYLSDGKSAAFLVHEDDGLVRPCCYDQLGKGPVPEAKPLQRRWQQGTCAEVEISIALWCQASLQNTFRCFQTPEKFTASRWGVTTFTLQREPGGPRKLDFACCKHRPCRTNQEVP